MIEPRAHRHCGSDFSRERAFPSIPTSARLTLFHGLLVEKLRLSHADEAFQNCGFSCFSLLAQGSVVMVFHDTGQGLRSRVRQVKINVKVKVKVKGFRAASPPDLLSLLVQRKVSKEALFNRRMSGQHAPGGTPASRVRCGPRDFPKGHPCPFGKRRASMHGALRVLSSSLRRASRGWKI